jgi:hypothetical protein
MLPTQYSKVFTKSAAKLATERMVRTRMLGYAALKEEGAATFFDNSSGQRWTFNVTTFEVGLGFRLTKRVIEDNQYPQEFGENSMGLVESFKEFKEVMGFNILNNAQTYDSTIGGDGVSLCNTAHPYDGGTWSNTFTSQLDLNEASLLQASINIQSGFYTEAGLRIQARPDKLLIPIQLIPVAERLTKSELRPGTVDNAVNAIRSMPGSITEYMPVNYLTSSSAWFLTTNIKGLVLKQRAEFKTSMWTDDATDNLMVKGRERYAFSFNDPRAIYGSFPT